MPSSQENSETGCCPRFDPTPWDEQEHDWQDKLFVKDRVRTFFHIPLNFGSVMSRSMKRIESADAFAEPFLLLADETSLWATDLYIHVGKEVPGMESARLSGSFVTKAFEGPYSHIGKWVKQMEQWVASRGQSILKLYFYYTTCPRCAKHYGKNHVVLVARV